jgi:hypothetical protein
VQALRRVPALSSMPPSGQGPEALHPATLGCCGRAPLLAPQG